MYLSYEEMYTKMAPKEVKEILRHRILYYNARY